MSSFWFKENYEIKIWHWRFQCFITVLSHFCVVLNSGFEFMCQSIFCSVLFRPSDPVPQTHTGGDVAASTLLVSVAGRSMNRLWHKMAAVGSMCTEAAQVQLASVCRYQRRQAEELLSLGPTGWTSRSRSYFPPLSLETLSLSLPQCLSISLSLPHFPSPAPALSPSLLSGESAVPHRPVCASAEMTSILSGGGGFIVLLLRRPRHAWNLLRAPVCLRILKSEWLHGC